MYAVHSYGDSKKSRNRRAEARKKAGAAKNKNNGGDEDDLNGEFEDQKERKGPAELALDNLPRLGDVGLRRLGLSGACQTLVVASFKNCWLVTSFGACGLLRGAPVLQRADFSGCHQV